ncbi:MAG: hypothetical protein LC750_00400 [Actinobacteria bacterium]|nr:hypothetical protein [Actinomycetota bacterium]
MARKKKQPTIEDAIAEKDAEQAATGHNKPELTDDEQRALLLQHKKSYEAALAVKKQADADFKNACKRAKAECGKGAVADIKDAIALEAPGGQMEIEAEIARKHRIARWMGLPVGAEPIMFEMQDRRQAVDIAYDNGKAAGMSGDDMRPPHDPSVPQYQRWLEGWHDGQEILLSALGKVKVDVPSTTPSTEDVSDPPFGASTDENPQPEAAA